MFLHVSRGRSRAERIFPRGMSVAACLLLAACRDEPSSTGPWQPVSVAYDPECRADCPEIAELSLGEVGFHSVRLQAAVDDEVAQWADCIQSVIRCIDEGGGVQACVAASACPETCRNAFQQQTTAQMDAESLLNVFEAIFIERGGACVPDEEREVAP